MAGTLKPAQRLALQVEKRCDGRWIGRYLEDGWLVEEEVDGIFAFLEEMTGFEGAGCCTAATVVNISSMMYCTKRLRGR